MDAAQKAKLEDQKRVRQTIEQMINARIAGSVELELIVIELVGTVDRLTGEVTALNRRIDRLERRA